MRTKVNLSLPIPELKGRYQASSHNFGPESILIISNSQEDVYRFIHSYYGSEIVLYNLSSNENIINDFELTNVNEFKEINKKLLKIDYQK